MTTACKRRPYDGRSRRQSAAQTARSILEAARALFAARGYVATTMPAIARAAGIALDTVYAAVGPKPTLFKRLIETAISGTQEPVPAEQRGYVRAIRAESDAARKLRIYAAALCDIHPRLAPLLRILQTAAPLDAELGALWREIGERRASNMLRFAHDLVATGQVRAELGAQTLADILFATGSAEFYLLLGVERGWELAAFERWLGDCWARSLLRTPADDASAGSNSGPAGPHPAT